MLKQLFWIGATMTCLALAFSESAALFGMAGFALSFGKLCRLMNW